MNTASAAGLSAGPTPAYRASKWGVVGLTRFAALGVAGRGIRNNAVCPGVIMTPMVERSFAAAPGLEQRWRAAQPIGRLRTPEAVADVGRVAVLGDRVVRHGYRPAGRRRPPGVARA